MLGERSSQCLRDNDSSDAMALARPHSPEMAGYLLGYSTMKRIDVDVCVVGGGVAGLCAGERIGQAGLSVAILEARDRLGGRILTEFAPGHDGFPIELGAEFIHGQPPTLLAALRMARLSTSAMDGRMYRVSGDTAKPADEDDHRIGEVLSRLPDSGPDESFDQFVRRVDMDPITSEWARSYVEGFNAADAKLIGTRALAHQQKAEDRIGGSDARRLEGGYAKLVQALAARQSPHTRVMLNTVVWKVKWGRGHAELYANHGQENELTVNAKAAIITAPISLVRRRHSLASIGFDPRPPVLADFHDVIIGGAARLNLLFKQPVWEEAAPGLSFLLSRDEHFPAWWTRSSGSNYLMTAWCGGPKTRWIGKKSKDELTDAAVGTLSTLLKRERSTLEAELQSSHYHDWLHDPFSCGSYSYVKAGGFEAAQRIALPVENTLWFAGEAMATDGHWGTVHGAMDSGRRAAEAVIASQGRS